MAINFPTNLDDLANVSTGDTITAAHKNDLNDIVEALEIKVGKDSSAVATTHDYKFTHLPAQAGDWDAGAVEVRAQTFESDVATGTAPIVIASTTKVTNLDADTVDGKHVAGTNGAGEIVTCDGTQTLTAKTLTSPDINTGTFNGTIDGNWTAASQTCANLGTVTTCDVNGGSVDGVTIGAAAAPTVTNLGSVTTCDINGGTVDGVTIGAAVAPTVTNLGTVTTCDINGGTIDGVTIGGAVAPTVTNLGTVTTCDINGGTVDGTNVGASTPGTGAFTTLKVGTTNQGDILYDNGTSLVRLVPGTSGYFLKTQGAAANPAWAAVSLTSKAILKVATTGANGVQVSFSGVGYTKTYMPYAGTLKNFYVHAVSPDGGATITVMKNGSDTALTLTPVNGVASDTTHTVSVAAGDYIAVNIGNVGSSKALEMTVEYDAA